VRTGAGVEDWRHLQAPQKGDCHQSDKGRPDEGQIPNNHAEWIPGEKVRVTREEETTNAICRENSRDKGIHDRELRSEGETWLRRPDAIPKNKKLNLGDGRLHESRVLWASWLGRRMVDRKVISML